MRNFTLRLPQHGERRIKRRQRAMRPLTMRGLQHETRAAAKIENIVCRRNEGRSPLHEPRGNLRLRGRGFVVTICRFVKTLRNPVHGTCARTGRV